ncbi:MAG: fructosamine kinase family protein [Planctomycetota bacterium]|jgi:fructosamine-3-kinase
MQAQLRSEIERIIGDATGEPAPITFDRGVGGGCISSASCVTLKDGRRYFVKYNPNPLPDMFKQEALALDAIRAVGVIRAPQPIGVGGGNGAPPCIVMEMIETGGRGKNFGESFGERFATFHRRSRHDRFGFDADNYIGSTPQPNVWDADWVAFWRRHRLGFQLDLAHRNGLANSELSGLGERLMDRPDEIIGEPGEPPRLLHGDLWGGNYLVDDTGGPVLIDPAAYYGRREADLAMTMLFGGFDPGFYTGYNRVWPLEDGAEQRLNVYKLYHLLNHLNLFGSSYYGQCVSILRNLI